MKLRLHLFGLLALLLASSCVSGKKITYYQNMEALEQEAQAAKAGLEIEPNDLLVVSVAAENIESVQPFNLPVIGMPSTGDATRVSGQPQLQTYLVNSEGEIQFPVLGTLDVAGLTRQQLSELLEEKIAKYVQNPIVNIRIANFQVTVLGEVNQPGTFSIPDEYLSLNKALGFAGDLTIYGKRKNVLIIRETEEGKIYKYVDLTDASLLNSPFYYLQQNDVVYVEPSSSRIQSRSLLGTATQYLSIASVITSLILVFTR